MHGNSVHRLIKYLLICSLAFVSQGVFSAEGDPTVERFKLSYRDAEMIQYIDAQEKFMKLLEAPGVLSLDILNDIDFDVKDVAFYRFNDRQ